MRVVPCNGALCSTVPAEVAGVTPRGDVAPTLKTYEADGQGVAPAVVAPATPTATPTGWRVAPTAGATIKYKPRTRAFQMTPAAKKA